MNRYKLDINIDDVDRCTHVHISMIYFYLLIKSFCYIVAYLQKVSTCISSLVQDEMTSEDCKRKYVTMIIRTFLLRWGHGIKTFRTNACNFWI